MVQIVKTWEQVYFTASKGKLTATIELSYNSQTKKYTLSTKNEESVSFKEDTIQMSKLKLEALKSAIKYISDKFSTVK